MNCILGAYQNEDFFMMFAYSQFNIEKRNVKCSLLPCLPKFHRNLIKHTSTTSFIFIPDYLCSLKGNVLFMHLFLNVNELRYVADRWRMDYNHYRPYSSLDYMASAAFAAMCLEQGSISLRLTQNKENYCELLS